MFDSPTSKPVPSPSHFTLESFIRPNILALQPYRCARDDFQSGILLDANENSLGHSLPSSVANAQLYNAFNLNRYPDPSFDNIKTLVAQMRGLPSPEFVFLGVGSDEVIDLLMRISCIPSTDSILITPPTYGMYAVCAQVNDIRVVKVPLDVEGGRFQLRISEMIDMLSQNESIKLVFVCSPGNPTGTTIPSSDIKTLLDLATFKGVVVVDEAYVDFSEPGSSAVELVQKYSNLCVMQTLSKSFGLAAIRLGIALAQPQLIRILSNTKAPYNISALTASIAAAALSKEGVEGMREKVVKIQRMRSELISSFAKLKPLFVGTPIGGNHANFVLLPVLKRGATTDDQYDNERALKIYYRLAQDMGVVVRYRGGEYGCGGCLRVTVGSERENGILLQRLGEALSEL